MPKTNKNIAVIDLFCGIGGLSHGFFLEGFNIIAGYDNDISCQFAFENNNKAKFFTKDITIRKPMILSSALLIMSKIIDWNKNFNPRRFHYSPFTIHHSLFTIHN